MADFPTSVAAIPARTEPLAPSANGEFSLPLDQSSHELLADWAWANERHNDGALDEYREQYVTVFQRRIVGNGRDPAVLRDEVGARFGIAKGRIAVIYVDRGDIS